MEQRKATDVIIALESKIDLLVALIKAQDASMKIMSNKLNAVMSLIEKEHIKKTNTPYIEQASAFPKPSSSYIPITEEVNVKVDSAPAGARRGGRIEASVPDNNLFIINDLSAKPNPEIIIPKQEPKIEEKKDVKENDRKVNTISVHQRVINEANKSIFLAEVSIFSLKENNQVYTGKTNANGKWASNLEVGDYKIIVSKRDNISKEKKIFEQKIKVDGHNSVVELPNLVIK